MIHRCYNCYIGRQYSLECSDKPFRYERARVPRKTKKVVKEFYKHFNEFVNYSFWSGQLCLCSIDAFYESHKSMIQNIGFFRKHKDYILKLKEYENGVYFDSGKLHWYWEDDNGLFTYDGIMPFAYNEVDAGDTWAHSEVVNLVYYSECELYNEQLDAGLISEEEYDRLCDEEMVLPTFIKDDISLIKYLSSINNKIKKYEQSKRSKSN